MTTRLTDPLTSLEVYAILQNDLKGLPKTKLKEKEIRRKMTAESVLAYLREHTNATILSADFVGRLAERLTKGYGISQAEVVQILDLGHSEMKLVELHCLLEKVDERYTTEQLEEIVQEIAKMFTENARELEERNQMVADNEKELGSPT